MIRASGFHHQFLARSDPTPGTPANEFKENTTGVSLTRMNTSQRNREFQVRKTDRGKMYILNGPPDEIVSHPSRRYFPCSRAGQSDSSLATRSLSKHGAIATSTGKGENVIYEFVDRQKNGEYTLEYYDPVCEIEMGKEKSSPEGRGVSRVG